MASTLKEGGTRFVWHGPAVIKQVQLTATKKLKLAAEATANQVKRNISIGRPASKPNEFPHVDTGRLRQSIFWTMRGSTTAIVGTPVKYGLYLEVGTRHMAPRPYLRRTLSEMQGKIERIFAM